MNNTFTLKKPPKTLSFILGLFITDYSNITNYFNLTINIEDSLSSLRRFIEDSSILTVHPINNIRIITYNIKLTDLMGI